MRKFSWKSVLGIFFLFFFAAVLHAEQASDQSSQTNCDCSKPTVTLNVKFHDGKIVNIEKELANLSSRYIKGAEIILNIFENVIPPPRNIWKRSDQIEEWIRRENLYEIEISHADQAPSSANIRVDARKIMTTPSAEKPEPLISRAIKLDGSGQKYTVKIIYYNSLEERLKSKDGFVIYQGDFNTYNRYFVGISAGLLLPIGKNFYNYSLYPKDPTDPSDASAYTIRQTRYTQTKAILFATIFPVGYEPGSPCSLRNFHINVGTEISSTILKSLYVGLGYDFGFFSFDLFGGFYKINELAPGYFVGQDITNKKISTLPLVEKRDRLFGMAVSFPLNLVSIFGKIIGLL